MPNTFPHDITECPDLDLVLYTDKQMQEFINKMAQYDPVKEEFTALLEVDVEEDDVENILAAAQKEMEGMGKQLSIFREKTVEKGREKSKTLTTESVFCKYNYKFLPCVGTYGSECLQHCTGLHH